MKTSPGTPLKRLEKGSIGTSVVLLGFVFESLLLNFTKLKTTRSGSLALWGTSALGDKVDSRYTASATLTA